jgi:hypothetical protein
MQGFNIIKRGRAPARIGIEAGPFGFATGRLAQASAMSLQTTDMELHVVRVGAAFETRVVDGATLTALHSTTVATDTVLLASAGGTPLALDAGNSLVIDLDRLGGIEAVTLGGAPGDPAGGVSVQSGNLILCISPLGFAHEGACS